MIDPAGSFLTSDNNHDYCDVCSIRPKTAIMLCKLKEYDLHPQVIALSNKKHPQVQLWLCVIHHVTSTTAHEQSQGGWGIISNICVSVCERVCDGVTGRLGTDDNLCQ